MTPTHANDLSNKKLLQILMQEIVDVRRELIEEMDQRFERVSHRFDMIGKEFDSFGSDLKGLRIQLHQNHTSFITNQMDLNKRMKALEAV